MGFAPARDLLHRDADEYGLMTVALSPSMARQAPKMHILVSSRPTSSLVFDHPLLQSTVSPLSQRPAARPAN
jgi:hypothetical protein